MIQEGSVTLPLTKQPISRKQTVFYNQKMKHNRDISVAILSSFKGFANRSVHIALPLEASGVRGIRILKESAPIAKKEFILSMNDHNPKAIEFMQKLVTQNGVNATITQLDSDAFFLQAKGFDYIDIDPFGTPNPFLDMAIKRLSRNAILAVTATDTATLCGAYPQVCVREYWANSIHCSWMHEIGLRILIAKIQKIGAQYDRALTPILSYNKDHYMRVYFSCKKSKEASTAVIQTHKPGWMDEKTQEWSLQPHAGWTQFGPIFCGPLYDFSSIDKEKFVESLKQSDAYDAWAQTLLDELDVDSKVIGYYNIPWLCKVSKNKKQPSIPTFVQQLSKKYPTARTIQQKQCIKSTIPFQDLIKILKEM
ncbi:MAG TPA: hypothetical protein VK158_04025 [Acidobacteriota bacterium]|nr:hypothetical protein [Acidobacteriota bacterium]